MAWTSSQIFRRLKKVMNDPRVKYPTSLTCLPLLSWKTYPWMFIIIIIIIIIIIYFASPPTSRITYFLQCIYNSPPAAMRQLSFLELYWELACSFVCRSFVFVVCAILDTAKQWVPAKSNAVAHSNLQKHLWRLESNFLKKLKKHASEREKNQKPQGSHLMNLTSLCSNSLSGEIRRDGHDKKKGIRTQGRWTAPIPVPSPSRFPPHVSHCEKRAFVTNIRFRLILSWFRTVFLQCQCECTGGIPLQWFR